MQARKACVWLSSRFSLVQFSAGLIGRSLLTLAPSCPRNAAGGNWSYPASLIRKRPHPQFLLADLPQPRQPGRFDDQEEQDQRADDHEAEMLDGCRMDRDAELRRHETQDDRQHVDQRGTEIAAEQ